MKQLITLISTEGKTMQQVQEEAVAAMEKFHQVHSQSLAQTPQPVQPKPIPPVSTSRLSIEELNQQAEREGMLIPKPPEGLQVILHQTSPKYPQKSVPVDQPVVRPQPQQTPPVNTPEQFTKKYSNLVVDNSRQEGVTQITNYPHTRKPQSSEIPVKK